MTSEKPRISVIIPTYDRPAELEAAVKSVVAQVGLGVDFDVELIIVDDASPTPQGKNLTADGLTLRIERHAHNQGPAAARNTGVAIATGDFVAFLDSDDTWRPDKLRFQVKLAKTLPADGLWAQATGFHIKRTRTGDWQNLVPVAMTTPADFAKGCRHSPGTTSFLPRHVFDVVGPIDASLDRLEDYEWYVRFGQAGGKLYVMTEVLADIDPSNTVAKDKVLRAISLIEEKHRGGSVSMETFALMRSYLQFEKGATLWRADEKLGALQAFFNSFIIAPRTSLHLAPIRLQEGDK